MPVNDVDPATMDALEFARVVKRASAEDLTQLMHSQRRKAVLDTLVSQMPGVFRADRARGIRAVVHWHLPDRPDGGADIYEFVIVDGTCRLSAKPERSPDLRLTLAAVDFLNLVTGNAHAVMLVMKGKLKTQGSARLTAKFPSLFDVPKP